MLQKGCMDAALRRNDRPRQRCQWESALLSVTFNQLLEAELTPLNSVFQSLGPDP